MSFVARNHPQQIQRRGADDATDDRRTPPELFDPLHAEFGFTLDAAATSENTKCPRFCGDGLAEPWGTDVVWCNPPYSDCGAWVRKAWEEPAATIVMLLPANRTEQTWWQDHIEEQRDSGGRLTTRFLRGRRRFNRPGWTTPAKGDRPPFGLVLCIWRPRAW